MAVLPILTWPDARLSTLCTPVDAGEDIGALVADMFETMYAAPGRGLAAPQVGVLKRIFVTDTTWKEASGTPMVFVNPRITGQSEQRAGREEGCLSIPGITIEVERPAWVDLAWTDAEGTELAQRFDGFAAVCVQHELDHLDGIVTFDRVGPLDRRQAEDRYARARA